MFTYSFDNSRTVVVVAPDGERLVLDGSRKAKFATVTKIVATGLWATTLFDDRVSAERHQERLQKGHDRKRFASVDVVAVEQEL